jgi:hypothetical protein
MAGFVCNAVIAGDGSLQTAMKESMEELGIQFPADVCRSVLGAAAALPATLACNPCLSSQACIMLSNLGHL